jgi:hypothetical protein
MTPASITADFAEISRKVQKSGNDKIVEKYCRSWFSADFSSFKIAETSGKLLILNIHNQIDK